MAHVNLLFTRLCYLVCMPVQRAPVAGVVWCGVGVSRGATRHKTLLLSHKTLLLSRINVNAYTISRCLSSPLLAEGGAWAVEAIGRQASRNKRRSTQLPPNDNIWLN